MTRAALKKTREGGPPRAASAAVRAVVRAGASVMSTGKVWIWRFRVGWRERRVERSRASWEARRARRVMVV